MIVCPDTYNVVDINKLLVAKFKGNTENSQKYDVHISGKLFAKHMKPDEQKEGLNTKSPNAK